MPASKFQKSAASTGAPPNFKSRTASLLNVDYSSLGKCSVSEPAAASEAPGTYGCGGRHGSRNSFPRKHHPGTGSPFRLWRTNPVDQVKSDNLSTLSFVVPCLSSALFPFSLIPDSLKIESFYFIYIAL